VGTVEVLNRRLQEEREALRDRFENADPFPHVVIPDFFAPDFCKRMLDDFPPFEERYALNEMGQVGGKAVRTDVRDIGETYRQLDDFIQTPEFLGLISDITGIPDLLYDPDYVGGGTHENLETQGLDPHVDFNYHPRTGWHRRLNLIVYLNPEWEESWGGNLDLHSDPWEPETDRVTTVLPLLNQAVIFETSEVSWHGFSPLRLPGDRKQLSRKSFAIYLYTKERPAEQIAASHATVYVPDGMPSNIKPGQVLAEQDYQAINTNFTRQLGQLKFLYERELKFNNQIDVLRRALEQARSGQRLDLQGYVVQTRAPTGWWPDGWVAKDFSIEFQATRPARAVKLDVWVPSQLESGQAVEIAAAGTSEKQELEAGEKRTLEIPISLEPGETLELSVRAEKTWSPKASGTSGDDRLLAYKLVSASVEH
jgi:hypothetical protein